MKLLVNGMYGSAPESVGKDDVDLDLMMGTLTLDNPPPADIDLVNHHTHIHTHTHSCHSMYNVYHAWFSIFFELYGALFDDNVNLQSDLPAIFLEDLMSTKVASVVSEITKIISIQDDPPQKW